MIEVEKSFREKTLRAMGILRLHLSLSRVVFFLSSLPSPEGKRPFRRDLPKVFPEAKAKIHLISSLRGITPTNKAP